jgi:hypothetical protein
VNKESDGDEDNAEEIFEEDSLDYETDNSKKIDPEF